MTKNVIKNADRRISNKSKKGRENSSKVENKIKMPRMIISTMMKITMMRDKTRRETQASEEATEEEEDVAETQTTTTTTTTKNPKEATQTKRNTSPKSDHLLNMIK